MGFDADGHYDSDGVVGIILSISHSSRKRVIFAPHYYYYTTIRTLSSVPMSVR